MLGINILSDVPFTNISPSLWVLCLFLSVVSFREHRFFVLMKSSLSVSSSVMILGAVAKIFIMPNPRLQKFSSKFSFRCFIVVFLHLFRDPFQVNISTRCAV